MGPKKTRARTASARRSTRPDTEDAKRTAVEVAGVRISSPDKVLYPDEGYTKEDVARWWEAVAEGALPLLVDRPLTLVRCPSGVAGECFFQKHAGQTVSDRVPRVRVREKEGSEPYMYLNGLGALLSLVQLGVLEFHVWNSRRDRLDRPDQIVMDLDPAPDVGWERIREAALVMRGLLEELGLRSYPRATGGKGLHVLVPLLRRSTWSEVKAFAKSLALLMEKTFPGRFTSQAGHGERKGRIYVDYLRNTRDSTAIATFSPRRKPGGLVAFPVSWATVESAGEAPVCTLEEPERALAALHDAEGWASLPSLKQSLRKETAERLKTTLQEARA